MSVARLSAVEIDAVVARHTDAFSGSLRKRMTGWLVALGVVAYLVFAWWFFALGTVLSSGQWGIAGAYLADWVTYEVRPSIRLEDRHLDIRYTRGDPLGENANPDWVEKEFGAVAGTSRTQAPGDSASGGVSSSGDSFMAPGAQVAAPPAAAKVTGTSDAETTQRIVRARVKIGDAAVIDVQPTEVYVTFGDQTLMVDIVRNQSVVPRGPLPPWAVQKTPGEKIIVYFGFDGRAEIEDDEVKVRHRFFGWANFVFDTGSPFWGKSASEVWQLVRSDQRIDPSMSNLALAWNDILYNAEWQHLDVWTKLLQTIVMAFAGTVLAALVAFPLAFLAARNITRSGIANQLIKRFFDFLRCVDMLIWALFFTRAFGPGPLAGISAIFFTDTGTFGKLFAEALENIDDKQREGIRSVGAAPVLVQRYGVLPQVLPVFASQVLYFWESNTRSATIIGAVGAGGIGLKLWEAMRTNSDWENVAYMVLLILMVVFIFDALSNALRKRLMGEKSGH